MTFPEFRHSCIPVRSIKVFALAAALFVSARLCHADALSDKFQAKADEIRTATNAPGLTAAIVLEDGRVITAVSGLADVEANRPLKPTDRILAGSTGKSFVAAAILLAVGEGKLDLDAKIEKYLGKEPWFDRLPNAHDITLRQLFNHTAGVAEHVLYPNFVAAVKAEPDKKWKAEELVAFNLDTKPTHPAGQGWDYADAHYNIAGLVYEKVTGEKLFEEIERRLLKPNGLTRTMPSPGVRIPDLATGYNMPNSPFGVTGRSIIDGKCFFNPQCEYGGGGIVSTPSDLAKWAKALYEGKVLPEAMLAEAKKTVPARTGRDHRYGMGIQERPSLWGNTIGHSGWFPGYLTDMVYVPSKRIAVSVQVTTDDQRKLGRSSYAMAIELLRSVMAE